jgi:cytochrome bd-type quinol oxidase subunit 2
MRMDEFIYVFKHPKDYWPLFTLLGALLLAVLLLTILAAFSLLGTWRAPTERVTRRLVQALVPTILGTFLLCCARVPLQVQYANGTRTCQFDLCWFFLAPVLTGGLAIIAWWTEHPKRGLKAQQDPGHQG